MPDVCDIAAWVELETDPRQREFRQAVHTVLAAIANSPLQAQMVIKGGILLAFRYHSHRHTRDLDFSTIEKYADFKEERFLKELGIALARAVESLDYGLDCRVQSTKIKPRKDHANFPTFVASVGYAPKGDQSKHRRLVALNSSDTVKIDYSFNEITHEVEQLELSNGGVITAYSLTDLVAEKYRAILQQEVRNRFRRQDAYDLFFLFKQHPLEAPEDKAKILSSLLAKSSSRGLKVEKTSMGQEEIERRSRQDYQLLADEIMEALPDFREVWAIARNYYESLPWG